MIRLLVGLLIMFGVAGGIDTMPADPSWSFIFYMVSTFLVGIVLAITGASKVAKQYE